MKISSQTYPLTANELNPKWREAFERPELPAQPLGLVATRQGDTPSPAEVPDVVVPMSGSTLLDRDHLAAFLHNKVVPRIGAQTCVEISAAVNDHIKMQHPELHSSADIAVG